MEEEILLRILAAEKQIPYEAFLAIALLLTAAACLSPASDPTEKKNDAPYILISKDNKGQIGEWLHILEPQLQIKEFYSIPLDSLEFYLERAQAVVIGGGKDIDPEWYDQPQYRPLCGPIDPYRDSLEYAMISYAREKLLPTMGICRGQQMINVSYGGTLIPDIPKQSRHLRRTKAAATAPTDLLPVTDPGYAMHFPQKFSGSIVGTISALTRWQQVFEWTPAPDSVIEAISLADSIHPFVQAVQFHPEQRLPFQQLGRFVSSGRRFNTINFMPMNKVNLEEKLALFSDHWHPRSLVNSMDSR